MKTSMPRKIETSLPDDSADQVTYTLSFNDVLAAYKVAANRRTWPAVAAAAAASSVLVGALSLEFSASADEWAYLAVSAFLGALLWPWLWQKLILPRKVRRIFAQQVALHYENTVSWSDDGIAWTSLRSNGRNEWSDYIRCLESPDILLFYLSDVAYLILPMRAMTAAHLAALRPYINLIKQHKRTEASRNVRSTGTTSNR
jgi:hypothetical protein